MNHPTAYLNAPLSTAHSSSKAVSPLAGLTLNGALLFVICLMIIGSGYMSLRPEVFGLALHPMLVPLCIAFPLVAISRITTFPMRPLAALSVFVAFYLASIVNGASLSVSELFKMSAAYVTILTCALLVRKQGDFVAGSLGLALAVAWLATRGIADEGGTSHIMDGANKNSYSMFALPAMLLSGFIFLRMPTMPKWVRVLLVASTIPPLFVIFLGGNRSGYLGAVIVGGMLFWNHRGRGLLLVAAIAGTVVLLISQFGNTRILDERMRQTVEGNRSDNLRIRLFLIGLDIALENPIIGVSPQQVQPEVGRRLGFGGRLETHNTIAHVMSGSGFICLAALGALGIAMWFPFPADKFKRQGPGDPLYEARTLLRMLTFLWFIRSNFSREILFNPAFNVAFGLCLGLMIISMQAAQASARQSPPGGTAPRPLPVT